jgi:hypothetical protein
LGPAWTLNIRALNTLRGGEIYVYSCLYELFDLSLKASSLSGGNEGVERCGIEALSAGRASWNRMKSKGRGLHAETILIEPLVPLEVEVTGKIPLRPRPVGSC